MNPHKLNIERISSRFAEAVAEAEISSVNLNQDRRNERLIARHIRNLRRCDRLRAKMKELMEEGKL